LDKKKTDSEGRFDLKGRTVLVTGATSGIGYYTARSLAEMDAQVIVGARLEVRGRMAVERLRQEVPGAQVEYLAADLSSVAEIQRFADEVLSHFPQLNVLVNNAAGYFMSRAVSAEGHEMTFALNHLNYFMLTNLLLERLKQSAPARVVNVSSGSHRDARMRFEDLGYTRRYRFGYGAYAQSKLANILFTYELDRRLNGAGVTANTLHPGFVRTGLPTKHALWPLRLFIGLGFMTGMSPEEGARTSVMLASDPELKAVSGRYFNVGRMERSSTRSYDEDAARRLWEVSERMTGVTTV
jgi:NAD(P)-dependent dehydrogenase (short-subunit alcohol dehydrogenase family)